MDEPDILLGSFSLFLSLSLSLSAPLKSREMFTPPYYFTYPDAYSVMERFRNNHWLRRILRKLARQE